MNFADVARTACLKAANLQRGGDSVAKGSLELASGKVIYIYIYTYTYTYPCPYVTYVSICSHDRHVIQVYAHAWGTILNLKFCHLHFQGYQPPRIVPSDTSAAQATFSWFFGKRPVPRPQIARMDGDRCGVSFRISRVCDLGMGRNGVQSYGSIENQGTKGTRVSCVMTHPRMPYVFEVF